jgi:hypothetical protein
MDANYIDNIDDATKSRLFDEILELKRFGKPEQFAEYSRRILSKGVDTLEIPGEEWNKVGAYLLDSPLSNREIGHVLAQLRRGYDVPEEMVSASFEDKVAYRNQQMAGLTSDFIVGKFEHYVQTRMEIERASIEAQRKDAAARFLSMLKQEKGGGQA